MAKESVYELMDFERLRISALTKAAEISPMIKEVTIGPNSPQIKQVKCIDTTLYQENNTKNSARLTHDSIPKEDQQYIAMVQEYEKQWHESAEAIFKDLLDKMIIRRDEIMEKYSKKRAEEYQKKTLEIKSRTLQMLKELQANETISMLEKTKLTEDNNKNINKKTIENMNRILDEQSKAAERFTAIMESHAKICQTCNNISTLLENDHTGTIHDKYVPTLKTIMSNINNVMEICKTGVITEKEVKQAAVLALNIDNLMTKIQGEIEKINQEVLRHQEAEKLKVEAEQQKAEAIKQQGEAAKQHAEAVKQQAETVRLNQEAQVKQEAQMKQKPLFFSEINMNYYKELQRYLSDYENSYNDLLQATNLKKFRFDCQKAVNTPVNALSSLSGSHIKDKFDKLSKLLKGQSVTIMDSQISAAQHPQGISYCTALLAKKIVRQGDLLVSSNPKAAFPLAALTVALWSQFPDLGILIEANFHKECPYLVPMFLPQMQGQEDKDFYKSRGYTYDEDGVIEKQDKFLKRMSGVFRLQCAIWIAKTPNFLNTSNPHSLQFSWKWLASFINLKPEPDISATLLFDFFTVCGFECSRSYGKQFIKIIKLICTKYLPILDNIDEGGPKTRLQVFLQDVLKTGSIKPPEGMLRPNTW